MKKEEYQKFISLDYTDKINKLSRKKAIRVKCVDCMGGLIAEVRRCPIKNCSLWPYRMGSEGLGYKNTAE